MKILFTAATEMEIAGLRHELFPGHETEFLVTGIGMVSTAYALTRRLSTHRYDGVVNLGIAGSFDRTLRLGEVVYVMEEIFSELGAEDDENFLDLKAMGFQGDSGFMKSELRLLLPGPELRKVRGITVNTTHGNEASIARIVERLHPQVESMEGGACLFVCEKERIPSIQLRAISNYVERRNKDAWNIPLAVENLHKAVTGLVSRW